MSEPQFEPKLDHTRAAACPGDLTEGCVRQAPIRIPESYGVEGIKELGTEFERCALIELRELG